MDLRTRVQFYAAHPLEHTGQKVVHWYEQCGDNGLKIQASLLEVMLEADQKRENGVTECQPSYTALLANPQGGKSVAQSFCSGFSQDRLQHVVVHISTQPLVAHEFKRKLTANMEPQFRRVDEIHVGGRDTFEAKPEKCSGILVTGCTPARLTQVAAILFNHQLWCQKEGHTYKVCIVLLSFRDCKP